MTVLGPFRMVGPGDVVRVACHCGAPGCSLRVHVIDRLPDVLMAHRGDLAAFYVAPEDVLEILEMLGARSDFYDGEE